MSNPDINLEKNKRGRPAIGRGEQINIMVRPEIAQALDAAAAVQNDKPARPEMIRRIVREWLVDHGYLPD